MSALGAFVSRYRDVWADVTGERLLSLWHPHGTVTDAATGERGSPQELARRIAAVKVLFPDLRLTPIR